MYHMGQTLSSLQGLLRSNEKTQFFGTKIEKKIYQLIKFGFKWIINTFKLSPLIKSPVESPLWAQRPKNHLVFGFAMNWSCQLVFREAYQQPLLKIEMGWRSRLI